MDPEGKRLAVLDAAEALFARRGYTGTSTEDVARAAGVAVGTVFRLFSDKAALLAALHERLEGRFLDAMRTAWDEGDRPYPERFEPMFGALLDTARRHRDVMPVYAITKELPLAGDYVPGARIRDEIEAMYREAVAAGAFRPEDPATVAALMHGMVDGGMRGWMARPTPQHRKRVVATLAAVARRAFEVTPAGRAGSSR